MRFVNDNSVHNHVHDISGAIAPRLNTLSDSGALNWLLILVGAPGYFLETRVVRFSHVRKYSSPFEAKKHEAEKCPK